MTGGTDTYNIINKKKENNKIEYTPEFESFWKEYPKQKGKRIAFNAWKEHPKKNHHELILAAKNYRVICDREKTEMQYIKDPSGFIRLKKEYWKDYISFNMPYQVGQSRQTETLEQKEWKQKFYKARAQKQEEIYKKIKPDETATEEDIEAIEEKIREELAEWTADYYQENPCPK